jgi:hypothetical protein
LAPTFQLTEAVLQKKRHSNRNVHCAIEAGTNHSRRGHLKNILILFEQDDIYSLQIPQDNVHDKNSDDSSWNGACVDTGAQKTVIGLSQAMAYCRFVGTKFNLQQSNNVYRFGIDKQ